MKLTVIACFIAIAFTSCRKESTSQRLANELTGNWELQSVSGMIGLVTYPTGNGNRFEFTANTYKRFDNGVLAKSGSYTVVEDNSVAQSTCLQIPPGQYPTRFEFDGNTTAAKEFFEISDNKLIIISGCFALDAGYTRTFVPVGK